ncbi:cryptochrome/photolyase family protein [Methylibium sp.]|uniref:cryptochrome/photolyase family protein n=1 Tax=Methylibium sp. TaxID=2067992 RepID=UPI003D0B0C88
MHKAADKPLGAALVWCRRDLRAHDHAALYHALRAARQVWVVFVFDREILDALPRVDRRVEFIRDSLVDLDAQLRTLGRSHGTEGVGLIVRHGRPREEIPRLAAALHVQAVYANADDEPAAQARDARVRGALADAGIAFHPSKDQVVFETDELLTGGGTPYAVFTPYKNAWLKKLEPYFLQPYPIGRHAGALAPLPAAAQGGVPALADIGFEPTNLAALKLAPGTAGGRALLEDFCDERIDRYDQTRDFPAVKGPSYLSVHLRFGTLSIRELAKPAWDRMRSGSRGAEVWLSELIWRDFYHQVLHHHPHVVERSFKPEHDKIKWEHGQHAEALFAAWCEGRTGYPLVDAAMHQINQTGYMHNRLRMVVASFLCKDLGLDWRWGERYFAQHLNDFDLAANNGGWQWASSSGCDAQPWFRIFNPVSQSQRFDAQGRFIRRYLPQLAALPDAALHAPWDATPLDLAAAGVVLGRDYPEPIVRHELARQRMLARYAVLKASR